MRNLLLALVMLPLFTMAQFITIDGVKYRTLTEFKSIKAYGNDTIVGISVQDTTSPIGAAGYAIITNEDTTLMYLNGDTMNMFSTSDNWKFTPELPCCTPDTIPLYNITTQCTTLTNNRWSPVLVDSFGNVSTTVCDTIQYLYVDTINYIYNAGLPYYSYVALLDQNGTDAPTIKILEDNLPNTLDSIVYVSTGYYKLYFNLDFDTGKTFLYLASPQDYDETNLYIGNVWIDTATPNIVNINCGYSLATFTFLDELLNKTSLEIKLYK